MDQILAAIQSAGIIGVGVMILIGGARQTWVWGWAYRACAVEKDYWRDTALQLLNTAEKATTLAEQKRPSRGA